MREYITFTKKEFTESYCTYKFMIMTVVFLIFGIMSPLFAKFTPEILKMAGIDLAMMEALGLGEPTAADCWAQFFKNIGQMGLIVLVIIYCGIVASELSKGTLINMLTKGMHRSTVIISKFTVSALVWSASYLLCLGVCTAYTAYYFGTGGLNNAFLAFSAMWLFGVLLIALLIFGGVCFGNVIGSLLTAGGAVIFMSIINIVPTFGKYNPSTLTSANLPLLLGQKGPGDIVPAVIICGTLIVALISSSIIIFNKKQI